MQTAATVAASEPRRHGEVFKTSCREIDDYTLCGGFQTGGIVVITDASQGNDEVARLIALHTVANTLLSPSLRQDNSGGKATLRPRASIIDRTGTFPLALLPRVLSSQLSKGDAIEGHDKDAVLQDALGRVDITRVFDLEGLWEVVKEAVLAISISPEEPHTGQVPTSTSTSDGTPQTVATSLIEKLKSAKQDELGQEVEIGDSQDEDDSDSEPSDNLGEVQQTVNSEASLAMKADTVSEGQSSQAIEKKGRTLILLVDGFTSLATELFSRKEKRDANAHLTTLSRVLHELVREHNILLILLNTSSTFNPKYSAAPAPGPSIFLSNMYLMPAIPKVIERFASLHLFISSLPRADADAEVLAARQRLIDKEQRGDYGGDVDAQRSQENDEFLSSRPVNLTHVLEVLTDEDGIFVLPDHEIAGNTRVSTDDEEHDTQMGNTEGSKEQLLITEECNIDRSWEWKSRAQRWCAFDIGGNNGVSVMPVVAD